jgi:hypothetical protein
MIVVLADHNIEGQAVLLWSTMATSGWLDLGMFQLVTFADMSLWITSSDRVVWRGSPSKKRLLSALPNGVAR